jgi:hypothetical protein
MDRSCHFQHQVATAILDFAMGSIRAKKVNKEGCPRSLTLRFTVVCPPPFLNCTAKAIFLYLAFLSLIRRNYTDLDF